MENSNSEATKSAITNHYEEMKKKGLIQDYNVTFETCNFELTPDGAITNDLKINVQIIPFTSVKEITVKIGN
jgi:hypothetical protein